MKDLVYFCVCPKQTFSHDIARNRQRECHGTSLFDIAKQGRDSLLDNWALVFALLLILVSTHDARLIVA